MIWIVGLAIGLLALSALRNFHSVGGTDQFTHHGHDQAMKLLAHANVVPALGILPGAASFQVVQFVPMGVSAAGVVNSAGAAGSIVLCTKNVLVSNGKGIFLAVTGDPATSIGLARPGGDWAILTPLSS